MPALPPAGRRGGTRTGLAALVQWPWSTIETRVFSGLCFPREQEQGVGELVWKRVRTAPGAESCSQQGAPGWVKSPHSSRRGCWWRQGHPARTVDLGEAGNPPIPASPIEIAASHKAPSPEPCCAGGTRPWGLCPAAGQRDADGRTGRVLRVSPGMKPAAKLVLGAQTLPGGGQRARPCPGILEQRNLGAVPSGARSSGGAPSPSPALSWEIQTGSV